MRLSKSFPLILALVAAALAGCASVTTEITVLDPAHKFAPTEYVMLLHDYPPKPYVKIALIEAQGLPGGSEAALLEEAHKRGAALGADAIVRQEVTAVYHPPVLVYDPTYANMFYPRYRYPYRSFYYPNAFGPFPYDAYRWVGGGEVKTMKAVAIRFTDEGAPAVAPERRNQ